MTVAHSEICDVSLFTTGSWNAGRVGYNLALDSRTVRCDWKVGVDIIAGRVDEKVKLSKDEANRECHLKESLIYQAAGQRWLKVPGRTRVGSSILESAWII